MNKKYSSFSENTVLEKEKNGKYFIKKFGKKIKTGISSNCINELFLRLDIKDFLTELEKDSKNKLLKFFNVCIKKTDNKKDFHKDIKIFADFFSKHGEFLYEDVIVFNSLENKKGFMIVFGFERLKNSVDSIKNFFKENNKIFKENPKNEFSLKINKKKIGLKIIKKEEEMFAETFLNKKNFSSLLFLTIEN